MAVPLFARNPVPVLFLAIALIPIAMSCVDRQTPVELGFSLRNGDAPLSCSEIAGGVQLTDLRLYLYDLQLIDGAGRPTPFVLTPDEVWQDDRVALLDFEDGQGACINGSAEQNRSVRGAASGGPFRGVAFTVGVPPDLNHRDPMTARAPLNYTAMHWHWLSGYKFMRVGVRSDSDRYWLHLGSSHCDGNVGAAIECRASNRISVQLADFDPARDRIVIDIAPLIAAGNLDDGMGSDCSSGPDEPACSGAFAALGLPFGANTEAASQRVFRSVPAP
jgi:uncharacterized repeat protein (TIGR04052 family)